MGTFSPSAWFWTSTMQPTQSGGLGSGGAASKGGKSGANAPGGNPEPTFQSSQLKCSIGTRQRVCPAWYIDPRATSSEFEISSAARVLASSGSPSPLVSRTAEPPETLRIWITRPFPSGNQRPVTLSYDPFGIVMPTGNERRFSTYP